MLLIEVEDEIFDGVGKVRGGFRIWGMGCFEIVASCGFFEDT